MQKWEYTMGSWTTDGQGKMEIKCSKLFFKEIVEMLNYMGKEGWELVGVNSFVTTYKPANVVASLTYTNAEYFYFKRQLS